MSVFQIPQEALTQIKDKVVLITGSTSGIGLATTTLCLTLGAKVIAGDVNAFPEDFLVQHQQYSTSPSPDSPTITDNLLFVQTDVTNWTSIRSLFETGYRHFGTIDHVFANAGVGPRSNFLEETFDEEEKANDDGYKPLAPPNLRTVHVNLIGVLYTVRLGVHYLRRDTTTNKTKKDGESEQGPEQESKSIVLTASASSFQPFSAPDYTTAKHGVFGILRGLMNELPFQSGQKIRLNAISPSWTETGLVPASILSGMGIEVQKPEAVARSVLMLFNDHGHHGEVIYSWGGKYKEIHRSEGGLLDGAANVLPGSVSEEMVLQRLKGRTV